MKCANLTYTTSSNLGDQIQSLAIEQFLPSIDVKFDRDFLKEVNEKEKHLLIMQGWFSHFPERCFPPADCIIPVFFGFHITDWNESIEYFLNPQSINFLKHHEPIGCRDRKTMEMLLDRGVGAFYSKCLTLTFPKRDKEPENGKVFLVDTKNIELPAFITKNTITLSHDVESLWDKDVKYQMAKQILQLYRDEASLVITTKLHCVLPCIAMGIPVIFFGNSADYRISILKDLQFPIYEPIKIKNRYIKYLTIRYPLIYRIIRGILNLFGIDFWSKIDWNPKPFFIEKEKMEIIQGIKRRIKIVMDEQNDNICQS